MLFALPLSSWGYGPAPFRLGIWIGPFPVEDTYPQKPLLSWRAPKGVWRWLGVKVLPVFANILTMFYQCWRSYRTCKCTVSTDG